jgi:type 1 glutamine amidotransferase
MRHGSIKVCFAVGMRRTVLLAVLAGLAWPVPATAATRVLVFSKTEGFRHDSIPAGVGAIRALGFRVDATEDPAAFTDRRLRRYDAVVWLSTTGDVLDRSQERAFRRYIRRGGGYVGVHAAADTEYGWAWYGRLLGARFHAHPAVQPAVIHVRKHVSTRGLPVRWERTDEWYDFRARPRGVRVLATLDESTYSGGTMGSVHPIAWCHAFEGGRAWYTGLGHTVESYAEPAFRRHLRAGIRWAARRR